MEENVCGGSGRLGAGCWGGTPLGQCPRLGIDTIERASFRLIKWVTASGCRIEDIDSLRRKKASWKKGKHRTTPQISLARGRDLIEREWVNWKMLPSFCECLAVWVCAPLCVYKCTHTPLNKHLNIIYICCICLNSARLSSLYIMLKAVLCICTSQWLCAQVTVVVCSSVLVCIYVCPHAHIYVWCVCVCVCVSVCVC